MGRLNIRTLVKVSVLVIAGAVLAPSQITPAWAQGDSGCAGISVETPQTPECDAVMAAQPYPDVTPIPFDLGVIAGQDFIYFDADEVPLYNAPNGKEIDTFTAGRSSYVNVIQLSDDGNWAEIRYGRWASLEKAHFAEPSTFTGVTIMFQVSITSTLNRMPSVTSRL